MIENQAKHCEDWRRILDGLRFQVGVNSFQNEKLVSKSARSQRWLCPFKDFEAYVT